MKLGNLVETTGVTKKNLMLALRLGAGAAAFPFAYGFIQSQLLLKASPNTFAQNTPGEYVARALSGVILGTLTGKLAKMPDVGHGMMASAVGTMVKDIISSFLSPAAAAQQAVIKAEEKATGEGQQSATNPLGTGLAGLGYGNYGGRESQLLGVGTPDLSGAGMFSGATVAIEQPGFSGATVAIESNRNFAGALQ